MRVISINELWEYVQYLANKEQTGAQVSPKDFNLSVPILTLKLISIYYGNEKEYRPGFPVPAIAFEITQAVRDYLSLYLKKEIPVIQNANGIVIPPDDHLHYSAARYEYYEQGIYEEVDTFDDLCTCGKTPCACSDDCCRGTTITRTASKLKQAVKANLVTVPVTIVDDPKWNEIMSHPILKPDVNHVIGRFRENGFQVAPFNLQKLSYTYLRYPLRAFWNPDYTTTPGIAIYNPVGSVSVELPDTLLSDIAYLVLDRMGMNVREPMLIEQSQRKIKDGF